jgi:hypothetical protein
MIVDGRWTPFYTPVCLKIPNPSCLVSGAPQRVDQLHLLRAGTARGLVYTQREDQAGDLRHPVTELWSTHEMGPASPAAPGPRQTPTTGSPLTGSRKCRLHLPPPLQSVAAADGQG